MSKKLKSKIVYKKPGKDSFDGERMDKYTLDEPGQPLTLNGLKAIINILEKEPQPKDYYTPPMTKEQAALLDKAYRDMYEKQTGKPLVFAKPKKTKK